MFDLPYCLPPTELYAEIRAAGYSLQLSGVKETPITQWVGVWTNPETGTWYLTSLSNETEPLACVEASGEEYHVEGTAP